MRCSRSWLALGLASVLAGPLLVRAAVVYKWTDADGVVHFSDQPVPGAEKIYTSSSSTRGILSQPPPPPTGSPDVSRGSASFANIQLTIISPAHEQTFSGDESVTASLSVEPAVQPGQPVAVAWTLNGSPVAEGADAMTFTLPGPLGRGAYTLGATLTDTVSGESKSAEPVTFNVLRPSVLSPRHK